MTISFRGRADKRPILYPLLHCLNQVGGGLLLTDNAGFRSLLTGSERAGYVGNIRIYAHGDFSEETLGKYEAIPANFRYVITDRISTAMRKNDRTVLVLRDGEAAPKADDKQINIRVGFKASKDKDVPHLMLTLPLLKSLYEQECTARFEPLRDAGVRRVLIPLFADILDMQPKAVSTMLSRGART